MSHRHAFPSQIAARSASSPAQEAAAALSPPPPVSTQVSEPRYSIRLAESPGTGCALCLEPTGAGPVGYVDSEPVCDRCLLEHCVELGMVLALVAVTREYAAVETDSDDELQAGLAELGAFARIYDRIALRSGPRRRFLRPDPNDGPVH